MWKGGIDDRWWTITPLSRGVGGQVGLRMIPVIHSTDATSSSSIHLRPYSVSPKDNSSLLSVSNVPQLRSHSTPVTPLLAPNLSNTSIVPSQHVQSQKIQVSHDKRLLMPTVYAPRQITHSPPFPPSKSSPSKNSRSRAGSISASPEIPDRSSVGSLPEVIVPGCKFEVAEYEVEIEGFQIYAVEKWYSHLLDVGEPSSFMIHQKG